MIKGLSIGRVMATTGLQSCHWLHINVLQSIKNLDIAPVDSYTGCCRPSISLFVLIITPTSIKKMINPARTANPIAKLIHLDLLGYKI